MKKTVLYLLLAAGMAACSRAPQQAEQSPVDGGWIRDWLLCGPYKLGKEAPKTEHLPGFYTDFLASAGGESAAAPKAGDTVSYEGYVCTWKPFSAPDSVVNLGQALGATEEVCCYAYTEVRVDSACQMLVSLSTDDGAALWVNGERVFDDGSRQHIKTDRNVVLVSMRAGANRFLAKVENKRTRWELCMRLLPFTPASLTGDAMAFRAFAQKDGTVTFGGQFPQVKWSRLVSFLRVRFADEQGKVLRDATLTGLDESYVLIAEPLPFGRYTATVDLTMKSGEVLEQVQTMWAGVPGDYVLFENGRSDYEIVLAPDASASERFAAQELQRWLQEAGGAKLPIRTSGAGVPGKRILVGFGPETAALLPDEARPDSTDESFTYRNVGGDILIYGGSQRGTMYGVFSLLEKELGCRWYTPEVSVTPKRGDWRFSSLFNREEPGIRVRNIHYYEAFDPIWSARNRNNGSLDLLRRQPGGLEPYWGFHTFRRLVPPDVFFESHPEYFGLINGERTLKYNSQLCLTNPEVLQICIDSIRKVMREHPEYLIYDVSQNDCDEVHTGACQCEKCQAIAREEGSESGVMIWFVNQIADAVKAEFPDKYIGTFAYRYTRKPPKQIRPRENVVVRFCTIECCFCHDIYSCPMNRPLVEDMEQWSKIAPNIYVWDYVVTFTHYMAPFPNFYVLQPNIQAFRRNHAIGIMEQGAYQARGGEFAELRAYVLSKLLWNPDCDVEATIDDFMYGYYGRAGQYVRAYFDLLHRQIRPDEHITIYPRVDHPLYTDAFIREAAALFAKAEQVADDDATRRRVEVASLPILYLKVARYPESSRLDGTSEKFYRIVEREGIDRYSEWDTFADHTLDETAPYVYQTIWW